LVWEHGESHSELYAAFEGKVLRDKRYTSPMFGLILISVLAAGAALGATYGGTAFGGIPSNRKR
jgi:hypothetical protein